MDEYGTSGLSQDDLTFHRLSAFHRTRVAALAGGSPPLPKQDGGAFVVHLIPEESLVGRSRFNAADLKSHGSNIPPFGERLSRHRFNCDGYMAYSGTKPLEAYSQVFRDGRLEGVIADVTYTKGELSILRASSCEHALFQLVPAYLGFCKSIGISTPIWLFATLINCQGVRIPTNPQWMELSEHAIDRALAYLPELQITSLDIDATHVLRTLCDAIWQTAGVSRSLNYDNEGKWHKPR